MHPVEISQILNTLTVLVDTREQPNSRFRKRLKDMGVPIERRKLNFGDYSAEVTLLDNSAFSLENEVCIERKMNLDEICQCYCKQRGRFTREFERAQAANAKMYLLIENANWEKAYSGEYRSQMTSSALVASLTAWLARYNCQLIFCEDKTSGKLIREILYREMKERLTQLEEGRENEKGTAI